MKHLNLGILADYEIPANRPDRLCGVQFGDDAMLLGLVDRLIDDANREGANVGLAVVQPGQDGFAQPLKAQDGLYTVFVRGEEDERQVRREQVVQCVLQALDPAEDDDVLMALAGSPEIRFALLHTDETGEFADRDAVCAALAARFLVERWRRGLDGLSVIVCGEDERCAAALRERTLDYAGRWRAGADFAGWLDSCRFLPALADCLVFRSDAEEAARLCAEMNYADAMIHLAEPYGLWAIRADAALQAALPLERCPQIRFVGDLGEAIMKKQRVFDAGLFAIAAAGLLHGNATLAECMKDEPLRDLVGHALLDEVLPYAPMSKEALTPYIIRCYERYSNPMNDNRLPDAARGLAHKFIRGVLPALRAYANEHFEPPKNLTVALSALILLYADARPTDGGYETVVGEERVPVHERGDVLEAFSRLSSDMSPDSLAYAVLSDRALWGEDLREIDGLEDAVIQNLSM